MLYFIRPNTVRVIGSMLKRAFKQNVTLLSLINSPQFWRSVLFITVTWSSYSGHYWGGPQTTPVCIATTVVTTKCKYYGSVWLSLESSSHTLLKITWISRSFSFVIVIICLLKFQSRHIFIIMSNVAISRAEDRCLCKILMWTAWHVVIKHLINCIVSP